MEAIAGGVQHKNRRVEDPLFHNILFKEVNDEHQSQSRALLTGASTAACTVCTELAPCLSSESEPSVVWLTELPCVYLLLQTLTLPLRHCAALGVHVSRPHISFHPRMSLSVYSG